MGVTRLGDRVWFRRKLAGRVAARLAAQQAQPRPEPPGLLDALLSLLEQLRLDAPDLNRVRQTALDALAAVNRAELARVAAQQARRATGIRCALNVLLQPDRALGLAPEQHVALAHARAAAVNLAASLSALGHAPHR